MSASITFLDLATLPFPHILSNHSRFKSVLEHFFGILFLFIYLLVFSSSPLHHLTYELLFIAA